MTPREKAEACYAMARSTTHAAERETAIGRGDAIVTKHSLDPASFDVPGRARPKAAPGPRPFMRDSMFEREASGFWTTVTTEEVQRMLQELLRQQSEASFQARQERDREKIAADVAAAKLNAMPGVIAKRSTLAGRDCWTVHNGEKSATVHDRDMPACAALAEQSIAQAEYERAKGGAGVDYRKTFL
jgi:hypothetical protein